MNVFSEVPDSLIYLVGICLLGLFQIWFVKRITKGIESALFRWAKEGNTGRMRRFLPMMIFRRHIHATDGSGMTLLMHAAKEGYTEIVKLLLEYGAIVTARSEDGWTALMLAEAGGHGDIIQILRERESIYEEEPEKTDLKIAFHQFSHGELSPLWIPVIVTYVVSCLIGFGYFIIRDIDFRYISFIFCAFVASMGLILINLFGSRGESKKQKVLLCLILGLFVWFLPWSLDLDLSRLIRREPHYHFYLLIFFGQGLAYGLSLFLQGEIEFRIYRERKRGSFKNFLLISSVRCLMGAAFLYLAFHAYCIPAIFMEKLLFANSQQGSFSLAALLPVGLGVSIVMAINNSVTNLWFTNLRRIEASLR